jgi:hypothetical protein
MMLPTAIADAIQTWADFKADHRVVARGLGALHLSGILLGGGSAIFLDRAIRRARGATDAARGFILDELARAHRVVVPSLVLVFATGALWTLSELDDFLSSPVYWLKMGLVAVLLINGVVMVRAERAAKSGDARGWSRLATTSTISLVLWFGILVAGKFL